MERDKNATIESISSRIDQLARKQQVDSVYLLRLQDSSLFKIPQTERPNVRNSLKKDFSIYSKDKFILQDLSKTRDSVVSQSLPDFVHFVCNVIQTCKSYSSLGSSKLIRVTYEASQLLIIYDSAYAIAVVQSEPD
ncbi:uncharacterized protein SOCG_02290 [Schizosaccharomyces octosporus yFS286]|uniref:Uncharacterized protein n=1 Tax=Schizosaccharomyces octosporus (strain yFS286) TaxID=483514 RepID=S9Q592_SCHOY|nr:uncharacterized protein SOCG_02290 [Schizosaccharomyces octosporus yFS286]EPX74808.1 hypothetical protein SOCG_02290 [Schizosaccharomyces octosporus yFS286]